MKKLIWISACLCMGLWACAPNEDPVASENPVDDVKKAIVDVMREWYFWNGQLPTTIDLTKYASNEALLDGII